MHFWPRENTNYNKEITTPNKQNISNNIPIPIIYPQNGSGKPNAWLAAQPAALNWKKKGRPDPSSRPAGLRPFFLKNMAGRLANQPCIWLGPSIWGVYYWYWYIISISFPYAPQKHGNTCFFEKGLVFLKRKKKQKGPCEATATPSTEFVYNPIYVIRFCI